MKKLNTLLLCLLLCQPAFSHRGSDMVDEVINGESVRKVYDQAILLNETDGILCQSSLQKNEDIVPLGVRSGAENPFVAIDDCRENELDTLSNAADNISVKAETTALPIFLAAGCVVGSLISVAMNEHIGNKNVIDESAAGLVGSAVTVGVGTTSIVYGPGVFFVPSAMASGMPSAAMAISGGAAAIPGMLCAAATHFIFYSEAEPKRPTTKGRRESRRARRSKY